jgi:hypothetical protein
MPAPLLECDDRSEPAMDLTYREIWGSSMAC